MASGFFALLDDIATLMDDVATMTKVAGKKTAGILGDDLAVNAEKAMGFVSSREIPVIWAITKGSFLNKLIILPIAFLLSAYAPSVIKGVLVLGGLYLAYEGVEKIFEYFFHKEKKPVAGKGEKLSKEEVLALEKKKIKSAVITDFILSVEIVIIALGTVLEEPLKTRILVVSAIALIATVGVYGIVALIVRMDDLGVRLINFNEETNTFSDKIGRFLVNALPWIIKALGVIGTLALLLVSGGIFVHNLEFMHHFLPFLPALLGEFIAGFLFGSAVFLVLHFGKKLF